MGAEDFVKKSIKEEVIKSTIQRYTLQGGLNLNSDELISFLQSEGNIDSEVNGALSNLKAEWKSQYKLDNRRDIKVEIFFQLIILFCTAMLCALINEKLWNFVAAIIFLQILIQAFYLLRLYHKD